MGGSRPKRARLDEVLVARGLCPDRATAAAWILAGRVRVAGVAEPKAGSATRLDAELEVVGAERRYVSRGGEKLEAALAAFALDPGGRTVLDAGASTGGFTDCLLQRGAARVYAVDAGFGQLRGKLASDPRVVNLERTNIGALRREQLDPPIDLAVVDLSYLSLSEAIPQLAPLFAGPAELVCLVKPLFEGVAESDRGAFERFAGVFPPIDRACRGVGLAITGLVASPILGSRGTVEFLMHARAAAASPDLDALVDAAIAEARELHTADT